jgi:DNA-binding transcriptional LysR family regulator
VSTVELRQLRYFVAVAEELHFGRAATRLRIAGPSLSQQIKALERSLGTVLLLRDRRRVELTAAGRQLLADAREILALADAAQRRVAGVSGSLRLGYVSWLPPELAASLSTDVRIDEWVMPSHIQIERVREGALDAAVAWAASADARLDLQLLWAEPLTAVTPSSSVHDGGVPAHDLRVLVDTDLTSWDAWNQFAIDFARDTGARVLEIDDGGITGAAFHDRCLRLGAPVLASPKRHHAAMPAGLRGVEIVDPRPLWCWSLVTRAGDERPPVTALRAAALQVARAAGLDQLPATSLWVPAADPHRDRLLLGAG